MSSIHLGVNVDHVATLRQARGTRFPDPVMAAWVAEQSGADSITVHLREDRRHIQTHDLSRLQAELRTHMNLELAVAGEVLAIACEVRPADACLVPERREELTTEGGLDVVAHAGAVRDAVARLQASGIRVALFIDPDPHQVEAAAGSGATIVELHTGAYADAQTAAARQTELQRLAAAARRAAACGLEVHAGHGLNEDNVGPVAALPEVTELNIGHAIIARAVFVGMAEAVAGMKRRMAMARAR